MLAVRGWSGAAEGYGANEFRCLGTRAAHKDRSPSARQPVTRCVECGDPAGEGGRTRWQPPPDMEPPGPLVPARVSRSSRGAAGSPSWRSSYQDGSVA